MGKIVIVIFVVKRIVKNDTLSILISKHSIVFKILDEISIHFNRKRPIPLHLMGTVA